MSIASGEGRVSANLKIVDRRKQKRFRAPDGAFTILWQEPHLTLLGKILDIGRGGFSFRYLGGKQQMLTPSEVEIVLHTHNFHLQNIPVKTISNVEVEDKMGNGSKTTRRCSVRFAGLSEEQKFELEHFIRKYTSGAVKT